MRPLSPPPVRAVVRPEPWKDLVTLYMTRQDLTGQSAAFIEGFVGDTITGIPTWRRYEEGGAPVPLLALRPAEMQAVAEALHDYLPPTAATEAHLDDIKAVRDRLLALVEHTIRGGT